MSLKTRFGNLGNVYDEDPSQTRILQLESPVLTATELEAVKDHFGANQRTIDCTFDAGPDSRIRPRSTASARRRRRPSAAAARR